MADNKSSFYQLIFNEGLYKLGAKADPAEVSKLSLHGSPFLFLYREQAEVAPELLEMLRKMIIAVQLDPSRTPVYDHAQDPVDFRVIKATETIKVVLTFGMQPRDLGIDVPYKNAKAVDYLGIRLFFFDSLSLIGSKPTRKKFLWTILKEIFSI